MEYNKENSNYFVYLMSTRAGGLGINLYTGDTVILYDSDWNPQVDLQAMDRVHRIGQKKPVHVYRLIAAGTVEERVVQRAKKKLYLDKMVNRGSTSQAEQLESLGKAAMLKMLKFGASAVVKSEEGNAGITDEALEKIMDRSRLKKGNDKAFDDKSNSNNASLNALDFDGTQDAISIRQLDGVTYEKDKPKVKEEEEKKIELDDYGNENEGVSFTGTTSLFAEKGDDETINNDLLSKKRKNLSIKDISEEWAQLHAPKAKRIKKTRFIKTENGYQILKANNYTMEEGEKSVFSTELRNRSPSTLKVVFGKKKGRQRAGRDYDHEAHCLMCWDGGSLLCCDQCPLAFHTECLAPWQLPQKKASGASVGNSWGCPHHYCKLCARKAHEVGGLLFRCTECPSAYCEDHVPMKEARFNESGRELRFEELGQSKPTQGKLPYIVHYLGFFSHVRFV
uniref:Helicase C-terminal domain-containing protein n=1 Tax=Aplanochytrium stocchinoi TaxID=215587 RepID=A0A7S3LNA8_9STRA